MHEIKQYFDDKIFNKKDVVDISVDTSKEDKSFDYIVKRDIMKHLIIMN